MFQMRNLIIWVSIYAFALGLSQVLLKIGVNQVGSFQIKAIKDLFPIAFSVIRNPILIGGTLLMASSFFAWLYILSLFKLSVAFPLTALTYVFVAFLSYFMLGEKLLLLNYLGILLIAAGIFFLLYK